jgi:methylmalonyl-CoA mutase N-terminal domain/subunit
VDEKQRVVVGVNDFIKEDEKVEIPILEIREEVEREQTQALLALKDERDEKKVRTALHKITDASANNQNIMPPIIEAAESYASLGEIVAAMKSVFGEWQEKTVI